MSSWSGTVIWWQVYPLGFLGAEKQALPAGSPVQHRLPALVPWLDYLVELGCNGLALNPVFASESHGYDIVDHFAIDPRLGDDADIDELIAACHDRGIRVLFDGVFNHVGRAFPGFVDVLANRQNSACADVVRHRLGRRRSRRIRLPELRGARRPGRAQPRFPGRRRLCRDGDGALAGPRRRRLAAGRRLRGPAGLLAHRDGPGRGPRTRTPGSSARSSTANSPTGSSRAGWIPSPSTSCGNRSGVRLNDGNFFELAWTLGRHAAFVEDFVPLTFVGNHDVTRIASKLTDPRHLGHALVGAVHHAGCAERLLRRRAGLRRRQGGPGRRRRRGPAGLPGRTRRTGRGRLADLPAAPAAHRAAPAGVLADRAPDRGGQMKTNEQLQVRAIGARGAGHRGAAEHRRRRLHVHRRRAGRAAAAIR